MEGERLPPLLAEMLGEAEPTAKVPSQEPETESASNSRITDPLPADELVDEKHALERAADELNALVDGTGLEALVAHGYDLEELALDEATEFALLEDSEEKFASDDERGPVQ